MSPLRWGLLFLAALIVSVLARMPAAWVAGEAMKVSRGQFEIHNTQGTIWRGTTDLRLPPSGLTLRDVRWRFDLTGLASLQWRYALESADPTLAGKALVGFGLGSITVADADLSLPARTATLIAPMAATFSPGGTLSANIRSLHCKDQLCTGDAMLRWSEASVSLAELKPLGDYQVDALLKDGRADYDLKTLKGSFRAAGKGSWQPGSLPRFAGELSAAPDQLQKVQGFMRLFGTPDERGVLRINR